MKLAVFFQAALFVSIISSGQTSVKNDGDIDIKYLVGIWQADTSFNGAAWLDNYQFFSNNRFIFNFNEYTSNKKILRFSGIFRIVGDTIIFNVKTIYELEGGVLKRGARAWQDEWVYYNPRIKEIKTECSYFALIRKFRYNTINPCILIDTRKYFKLENNPQNY